MSRLTRKYDDDSGYTTIESTDGCGCGYDDINIYPYNDCVNKLGELEDLEEELGVDLITLFKALKDGIIYFDWYGEIKSDFIVTLEKDNSRNFYISTYNDLNFYLKDYKKTWWLEKPEENEDERNQK